MCEFCLCMHMGAEEDSKTEVKVEVDVPSFAGELDTAVDFSRPIQLECSLIDCSKCF